MKWFIAYVVDGQLHVDSMSSRGQDPTRPPKAVVETFKRMHRDPYVDGQPVLIFGTQVRVPYWEDPDPSAKPEYKTRRVS